MCMYVMYVIKAINTSAFSTYHFRSISYIISYFVILYSSMKAFTLSRCTGVPDWANNVALIYFSVGTK